LGKQLLLQTGNTFAETRLYNPLEVLVNTDPFIGRGTIRHIVRGESTKTNRGALQQETLNKFASTTGNSNLVSRLKSQLQNTRTSFLSMGKVVPERTTYGLSTEFYVRPEDNTYELLVSPSTVLGRPGERWFYEFAYSFNPATYSFDTKRKYLNSRLMAVQPLDQRGTANNQPKTTADKKTLRTTSDAFVNTKVPGRTDGLTFSGLENRLGTNGYFNSNNIALTGPFTPSELDVKTFSKIFKDPLNNFVSAPTTPAIYGKISGDPKSSIQNNPYNSDSVYPTKSDIIKFAFTTNVKDAQPVHFRAFLSSLKQNVKPDFNEQRYVGRTERFVTYGGARRTATFQFHIAAFSETEIKQAWARVNYLTGLAFPTGFSDSGFMVPPLFKLSIGGIYDEQPCYLDALDFDFLDETTTFDIDEGVSQVIVVNMSVILLEKRSRFYDSPFYKIVET
jgi:hypothetical protein